MPTPVTAPRCSRAAGCPLQDMEFFQFHPTGIRGLGILITEAVRGEGGILRNRNGERFMERYAPTLLDLAPRDMISRAILTEIKAGNGMRGDGTIDDYVLLDTTHLGREVMEKKLPDITGFCRTYLGIDPSDKPIPIQPTAHYAMGGIPTDIDGRVIADGDGGCLRGPVRRGGVRLRVGARRQPAGHEQPRGPRGVRPAGGTAHRGLREEGRSRRRAG